MIRVELHCIILKPLGYPSRSFVTLASPRASYKELIFRRRDLSQPLMYAFKLLILPRVEFGVWSEAVTCVSRHPLPRLSPHESEGDHHQIMAVKS